MDSANFTPEGLTCQANLLHMFNSPQLATIFQYDPTIGNTAKNAAWSKLVKVGDCVYLVR